MSSFVLYALAVWRLSVLLVREEGPFGVARKLRVASGIEYDVLGRPVSWPTWNPLHCTNCTSIWVACVLVLVPGWVYNLFAASAVTVLIERHFTDGN